MFYSQSFDNLSRFDAIPQNLPSLQREFSKSESAIETPTTTSDERHSSPCTSLSRSFSKSPPTHKSIESWQTANEAPIWQKGKRKGDKVLRFTIDPTAAEVEEKAEEKGRSHPTPQFKGTSSNHQSLSHRRPTEKGNDKTMEHRIVLMFRKYKIGDPESTV